MVFDVTVGLGLLGTLMAIIALLLLGSIESKMKALISFWMKGIGTELEKHTAILEQLVKQQQTKPPSKSP